jgi:hypothetical protein
MLFKNTRYRLAVMLLFASLISSSCGERPSLSNLSVSDVAHTPVKRQSIGNCWLYATSSWAESLHLSATGQTVNLSESYWTYWDWYYKVLNARSQKVNTSGSWMDASRIIRKHGYMLEADFIAGEADSEISTTQKTAEEALNLAMREGQLKDPANRTAANVMAALDQAFGVKMSSLKEKIRPASELRTNADASRGNYSLADEIAGGRHAWTILSYPQLFGPDPRIPLRVRRQRASVLQRALEAVNQKKPVIMSVMIEFSALNTEKSATFDYDLYLQRGYSSGQGGHLLVLEDYAVENVPGVGSIGEGDVSNELKEAALQGDLKYLVTKNSWGTERPDRGLSDGYTRFTADYLNRPLPFGLPEDETDISRGSWHSALSQFIVPPEF